MSCINSLNLCCYFLLLYLFTVVRYLAANKVMYMKQIKQEHNCRKLGRPYYFLVVYIVFYGNAFGLHTLPLAVKYAACVCDSFGRISDCEVVSAVLFLLRFFWLNDTRYSKKCA